VEYTLHCIEAVLGILSNWPCSNRDGSLDSFERQPIHKILTEEESICTSCFLAAEVVHKYCLNKLLE
jgi:hypothetical protein